MKLLREKSCSFTIHTYHKYKIHGSCPSLQMFFSEQHKTMSAEPVSSFAPRNTPLSSYLHILSKQSLCK